MSNPTQAALEALARSAVSTRHLMAVEMLNAQFPNGVIRVVNYDYNITVGNEVYTGTAMDTALPEIGPEPDNDVRLRLDGTAGTFQFYLNQANMYDAPVYVNLTSFLYNVVTEATIDVLGVYNYELKATQFDLSAAMLQIGSVSPSNQPFPNVKYNSVSHPALYR